MPTCVPIKDMRDTVAFADLVENAPGPITVTKNGYDQFVVIRSKDFDAMQQNEAKAKILERMLRAERERATGQHVDATESIAALREKYGL